MLLISYNFTVTNFKYLLFGPIKVLRCEVARLISDFLLQKSFVCIVLPAVT